MLRLSLTIPPGKKAFFASDFHLGSPDHARSLEREKKLVRWLDSIEDDCSHLFLLGDLFDFWFDYAHVVPKGFVRFLGKLASFTDRGIPVYLFTGNHDMWMFGYLEKEIGARIFREPIEIDWGNGQVFMVGHGDGLGPGDYSYKFLKQVFRNPVCQRLFAFLHPWIGMSIANAWSKHSRASNHKDEAFLGEAEYLWTYCKEQEAKAHRDLYLFGHRHLPLDLEVSERSRYINLGEWMNHCLFGQFDGQNFNLEEWRG
jgi:UDP-2,3-diacylglucosamine hydrolase